MINNKKVYAIILARGGSKRVPRKNVKILAGKPLIMWTFEEAKKSQYIDEIILSTDDNEIALLGKENNIRVPFMRPAELASDTATDLDSMKHAIKWLKDAGESPDIIVHLRPTAPLRTVEHIDKTILALAENENADSARTVTEPEQTPYKMYSINASGYLEPLLSFEGKEAINIPSQLLPKAYKHVGYVDVFRPSVIDKYNSISGKNIVPVILEKAWNGINTPADWEMYEFLMRLMKRV